MDHPIRKLNVFILAMLCMGVVISLRNLPLTAGYGFSAVFYYAAATLLFMIPIALISAELASGWPKQGGIYIWVREAVGERWGFFAMWMQWAHNLTWYPAILSFVGAGIAYVFNPELASNKWYLLAVILIGFWGITFLNFFGIRTSALVSTICLIMGTLIPGLALVALAILWLVQGNPSHISFSFSSFLPHFKGFSSLVFLSGILLALSGIEANANLAREVKNPQKSYPRAIFLGAMMTLIILVFGSLAISIVMPQEQIGLVAGVLEAFRYFFEVNHVGWLVPIIAIFTVLGALGELNAWVIAGAKGLFATTEHGALPPYFHKVNRHNTPTRLLISQAVVVTVAAFVFLLLPNVDIAYWILNALSAQMYLLMYIFLFLAGVVLRYKKPAIPRPYSVPGRWTGIWTLAILGALSSGAALLISFFPPQQFPIGNLFTYELILIGGFALVCIIPLWIHQARKPHWKLDVLQDIREEIHKSYH